MKKDNLIDLTLIGGGSWVGLDSETGIVYNESTEYPYDLYPVGKVIGWRLLEAVRASNNLNNIYECRDDYRNDEGTMWSEHLNEQIAIIHNCINWNYYDTNDEEE